MSSKSPEQNSQHDDTGHAPVIDVSELENIFRDIADVATPESPDAEDEAKTWDSREREAKITDLENLVESRKDYAAKVYWIVVIWLIFLGTVILAAGTCPKFTLSDGVLISLVTGATVNLIGLFAIVVKYFFTNPPK